MADPRWTLRLDGTTQPDKALIGGKAWSIARMRNLRLPVPPAFVITTDACRDFMRCADMPAGLLEEVNGSLAWLEEQTGRKFGGSEHPLLLSVRSGAMISMPGMMDTVLNLGIDSQTEQALARETGLPDFARDTHRRFLELYATIVLKTRIEPPGVDAAPDSVRQMIRSSGKALPESLQAQLQGAIRAVFESWNSKRAVRYRDHHNIPHTLGTAVTIQAMVFGNLDERSGTGVLFSRNPLTGEHKPYGEYLPRAQGEDVVSGRFTPLPIATLRESAPATFDSLIEATELLEREHADMQDIEFTVQSGQLFLLQARAAKRAPPAAVRAAVDMVSEGMIDEQTALHRVGPEQIRTLLLPRLKASAPDGAQVVARGEGACPGVASGTLVSDPDEAERRSAQGEAVILLRATTSPEDLHGMIAARAIVTEQGGSTSHAAVVSRALGRPCVVGVGAGNQLKAGDQVTVDGGGGVIYAGALAVETPREADDMSLRKLIAWARARTSVEVISPAEFSNGEAVVDIDPAMATGTPEALRAAFGGAKAARGAVLADPTIARIAIDSGVRKLITEPVLPVLLSVLAGDHPT